ncbi:twin-arginine translocase subunit TatC [Actinophytocola oryzae]|uniref:Sec-independent protein translocase protein TatC n=1 Tax=Actinophytocola oryzae TaxID=502181 RepID=A0A4R7V8I4_9PSEU|nr:twin-arginine translocase subunit TatC [Actinophytocola oryzae]TDV44886.1 sec-independent protein translocase protein TatC [Actinophytocola oryzae]
MARSHRRDDNRHEKKRLRSRRHNPDGTMTLRDHLYELRHRLGLALLALIAGCILGFLWFQWRIGPIPSLGQLMTGPYCELPVPPRFEPIAGKCQLLQTQPFEAFLIQFKVGLAAGAVFTSPLWLYQIWAFITPGLYDNERRFTRIFVLLASFLFACGAVLAYYVVPKGLQVLVSFGGDQFVTALAANEYISFILVMLLIFGVSFELPLVITMLNRIGVLPYRNLKKWRRGIIFVLFVFAAFATPGTDPIGMLALAGAMTVLFELAVQVARIHDRGKAKAAVADGWGDHPEDYDFSDKTDDVT